MTTDVKQNEAIGVPLGRVASGVYILTAADGEEKVGMIGSWVMQTSFDPPGISVAVHPDRELYKLIEKTGKLTVNVISKDAVNLMQAFGKYSPDQFDKVGHDTTAHGVVLNDAIAVLECEVRDKTQPGDHVVFFAEVKDGKMLNPDQDPFVHLRKSGFSY